LNIILYIFAAGVSLRLGCSEFNYIANNHQNNFEESQYGKYKCGEADSQKWRQNVII
jgi:hypothetical protein